MSALFRATQFTHDWIRGRLRPGDIAVDATAGTGRDTLFLAQQVGESGRVYAFDVQAEALEATRSLLEEEGLLSRVVLHHAGHETLERHLPAAAGPVRAVMFNLGYLPGGDHSLITRPASTLAALEASLRMLAPGGLVSIVCYPAHPGGGEEAEAVVNFCRKLDPARFRSMRCHALNFDRSPPFAIAIEKNPVPLLDLTGQLPAKSRERGEER